MADLGIGVLGSGYMGRTYAQCVAVHNKRARLVAIAGGTRAAGLATDFGVGCESTYEALLARRDVDAVIIATPHSLHREQVIQAASAGKHVLVEKPMATSTADCTAMIEACRRAGVMLEVIATLQFRGSMARGKRLIDEGRLGRVLMMRGQSLTSSYEMDKPWAGQPENGGAYLDMGVHNFGLFRHLCGSEAELVTAKVTTFGSAPYPWLSGMTQIQFANGAVAQQWTSFELPPPGIADNLQRYQVVGEKAILDIDGYGKLQLGEGGRWQTVWEQPPIDFVNRPMDPVRLEAFFTQTQAFADDILDSRPPTVSGEDGRAAVAIVEAGWRSSETGQAVRPARE